MDFLDCLFWHLFARRLGPASHYCDVLETWTQLRRQREAELSSQHTHFLKNLSSVFAELEVAHPSLRGFVWPEPQEVRDVFRRTRAWARQGFQFLPLSSADFPRRLLRIEDPPRGLFVWGEKTALLRAQLAVVGSRSPSLSSCSWIENELRAFLESQPGLSVASGGARGVDQCAHRVSLSLERETLIFLPSGFEQIYPRELRNWVTLVHGLGGAFVSEYDPTTPMQKSYFGERNRLISGIAEAVLIIEARRRSGTLLTARAAADQGRAVFVVPGHPYDIQFSGSLDLLGEGATMVRDAQELSVFFQAEVRNSYPCLDISPSPRAEQGARH